MLKRCGDGHITTTQEAPLPRAVLDLPASGTINALRLDYTPILIHVGTIDVTHS
jgi:hypothetical protein